MKKYLLSVFLTLIAIITSAQQFNTYEDLFNYFATPKTYEGRGQFFSGKIQIRTVGDVFDVYVNGKRLSSLGLQSQNQKFLFGDYARLAIYDKGRAYPVIIHLPDAQHPYDYFYFEPIETQTASHISTAMHIPVTKGWMWVEPDIQNGNATLVWHTDSKTRPIPIIYKLINERNTTSQSSTTQSTLTDVGNHTNNKWSKTLPFNAVDIETKMNGHRYTLFLTKDGKVYAYNKNTKEHMQVWDSEAKKLSFTIGEDIFIIDTRNGSKYSIDMNTGSIRAIKVVE